MASTLFSMVACDAVLGAKHTPGKAFEEPRKPCELSGSAGESSDAETTATGVPSDSSDDEKGASTGSDCGFPTVSEVESKATAEPKAQLDAKAPGGVDDVDEDLSMEAAIKDLLDAEGVAWLEKAAACLELLAVAAQLLRRRRPAGFRALLSYTLSEAEAACSRMTALALHVLAQGPGREAAAEKAAASVGFSPAYGRDAFSRAAACVLLLGKAAQAMLQLEDDAELRAYVDAEAEAFALTTAGLTAALLSELHR